MPTHAPRVSGEQNSARDADHHGGETARGDRIGAAPSFFRLEPREIGAPGPEQRCAQQEHRAAEMAELEPHRDAARRKPRHGIETERIQRGGARGDDLKKQNPDETEAHSPASAERSCRRSSAHTVTAAATPAATVIMGMIRANALPAKVAMPRYEYTLEYGRFQKNGQGSQPKL